jgi:hypothetical protein
MLTKFTNPDHYIPRADRYAAEQIEAGWYDKNLLNEVVKLNREDEWINRFRPAGLT